MRFLSRTFFFLFLVLITVSGEAFAKDTATVTGVRFSTDNDRLRVVIDTDKPVNIKKMVLKDPVRLVVDIKDAVLSSAAKRDINVKSKFGNHLKVAQFDKKTVRVVINVLVSNHSAFTLSNPNRVVIDIGDGEKTVAAKTDKNKNEKADIKKTDTDDKKKSDTGKKKNTEVKREKESSNKDEAKKDDEKNIEYENLTPVPDSELDREIANLTGLHGKKIGIDPGHGGSDAGAVGPTGAMEKEVTLAISLELKKLLEEEGATVVMTRETDVEVSPKKAKATAVEELQARVDIVNDAKVDIFLSIHMDSFTNNTARGTTGYYFATGSKESRSLADKVRANIVDALGTMSRGTQTCNFYVVKHSDMPATLIEVAFISHPDEEKLLTSKEGVRKAATAIADGISDYFG
ncbi:MAG: N-acetylmuramoyl-L-alanine amidase, partial [Selenomonadaceae bacterium]|nr:N-acetylmuramoyl-L-alanine amidase [Selenomonadaceae bacterium]